MHYTTEDMESIAAAEKEASTIEGEMCEAVREAAYKSRHEPDAEAVVVYLSGDEFLVEFLNDDHIRAECMTADASLRARTTIHDLSNLGLFEIALALEDQARTLRETN